LWRREKKNNPAPLFPHFFVILLRSNIFDERKVGGMRIAKSGITQRQH
jgi:hypothetical protein